MNIRRIDPVSQAERAAGGSLLDELTEHPVNDVF
jgi:hypothetical protein